MDQLEPDEPSLARADDEPGAEPAGGDDSDAPVRLDGNGHLPAETGAGDVRAENVTPSQGGGRDIEATSVSITQGGAGQVRAHEMHVNQGGVGLARTDELTVGDGGSAFVVLSDRATVEEGGNVFLLVAGEVSGDVQPVIDWRTALALCFGIVVAWRLVRRIFQTR